MCTCIVHIDLLLLLLLCLAYLSSRIHTYTHTPLALCLIFHRSFAVATSLLYTKSTHHPHRLCYLMIFYEFLSAALYVLNGPTTILLLLLLFVVSVSVSVGVSSCSYMNISVHRWVFVLCVCLNNNTAILLRVHMFSGVFLDRIEAFLLPFCFIFAKFVNQNASNKSF